MSKIKTTILKSLPARSLNAFAKRTVLPGSGGLSVKEVAGFFFKQVRNTKLNERSAAATYNFVMALPPTLLFLFSLVPFLPLDGVQETINYAIFIITPSRNVQNSITQVVDDFMNNERRDLLSFGIILTIFFSSNGMMGLMRSFDRSHDMYVKRTGLKRRWTAIKLTLMLIVVAVISIAVLVIQSSALNDLILKLYDNVITVKLLSFAIVVAIIFFSICIIYTYGPSLKDKFDFMSPGAFFATTLIVLATAVFFFLVDNFLNYNKVYGPIGTIIAFMVWIRINTLIILLGYELNVSIIMGKTEQEKKLTK
jgi:membrane protein